VASSANGDIHPGGTLGAYFRRTRFISEWLLSLNGRAFQPMIRVIAVRNRATYEGTFGTRSDPSGQGLLMERFRQVGTGLQEDFTVRNLTGDPLECSIDLRVSADFASMSDVEGGRTVPQLETPAEPTGTGLWIESEWRGHTRSLDVMAPDASVVDRTLHYDVLVPAGGHWETHIIATPRVDDRTLGTYQAPGL
jgi:hypothetical protein